MDDEKFMDDKLKSEWKQTGNSLGKAFRNLGKSLINTGKKGVDRAVDWAETPDPDPNMVDTVAEDVPRSEPQREPEVVSVAEEISRLAELRDKGILTEEEFQAKKQQLLGL